MRLSLKLSLIYFVFSNLCPTSLYECGICVINNRNGTTNEVKALLATGCVVNHSVHLCDDIAVIVNVELDPTELCAHLVASANSRFLVGFEVKNVPALEGNERIAVFIKEYVYRDTIIACQ